MESSENPLGPSKNIPSLSSLPTVGSETDTRNVDYEAMLLAGRVALEAELRDPDDVAHHRNAYKQTVMIRKKVALRSKLDSLDRSVAKKSSKLSWESMRDFKRLTKVMPLLSSNVPS
ncbi:hypothetical protein NDU88_005461 [Pleurodeles waltl]|uniref:Uncharacterized protein n=1 Tax=Pleurodeles waltl TaxID=8319 RepID=A0AAV7PNP5_PLEWA|nr:hypothetical protein NDU88_005461 [Pleurodeles waltl]